MEKREDGDKFDLNLMTIGVLAQFRSEGLGSLMMKQILSIANHDDRIVSVYLHVKVRFFFNLYDS